MKYTGYKNKIMGKTDNIKRAKKLREAKRKREQDALIAAGLGPAGRKLRKKTSLSGVKTIIRQSKVKYSDLLYALVDPIILQTDSIATIKTKYTFGTHVWNAAIMREKSEEFYQSAKKDFTNLSPNLAEIGQLFDEMAKQKQEAFSEYTDIIIDLEIKPLGENDYDLAVALISSKDFKV